MNKLKSCPFNHNYGNSKNRGVFIMDKTRAEWKEEMKENPRGSLYKRHNYHGVHWIECDICGARGPSCDTKDHAWEHYKAWNNLYNEIVDDQKRIQELKERINEFVEQSGVSLKELYSELINDIEVE